MNWPQFDSQLELILKDPTYIQFPISLRINSYNWAIDNLTSFEPKQLESILSAGSRSYNLPQNFYELVAIWDGSNWCNSINFSSDSWTSMPNPTTDNVSYERAFWIFNNQIKFTKSLTSNGILYYHGKYNPVLNTNSAIDIPNSTIQAIIYWTVAACLNPKVVQQGKVAIWGKTNQPGLTSKSMVDTYAFYWNEGVKILESIKHKDSEMTLIARERRDKIN
jgi:hypothetical protein